MWSVSTSCMSSTDVVPVSTGNPVLDSFFDSLLSFLKNLSYRLDDLTVEHNLLSEEVGKRNEAVDELGANVANLGNAIY